MAAKRITQSAVNWGAIAERCPPHQKAQFVAFKARSDQYLRRMLQYPEQAPKIDWTAYKSKIPVAGMVDDFQKQYTALNIPYPADTLSSQIDNQEKDVKADIEKYKAESNARIAKYKKELEYLAALIPYDQMTMEDFRDAFPDEALDPINRPTFWPHNPEDQPGYVAKDAHHTGH